MPPHGPPPADPLLGAADPWANCDLGSQLARDIELAPTFPSQEVAAAAAAQAAPAHGRAAPPPEQHPAPPERNG
eukprot:5427438-Pyramimonas_sp.AAC.1